MLPFRRRKKPRGRKGGEELASLFFVFLWRNESNLTIRLTNGAVKRSCSEVELSSLTLFRRTDCTRAGTRLGRILTTHNQNSREPSLGEVNRAGFFLLRLRRGRKGSQPQSRLLICSLWQRALMRPPDRKSCGKVPWGNWKETTKEKKRTALLIGFAAQLRARLLPCKLRMKENRKGEFFQAVYVLYSETLI